MTNLTNNEKRIMNNLTNVHDMDVDLGNKIQEIITGLNAFVFKPGTPVNAEAAEALLTISGVVLHGETVAIGNDVFEFTADEAHSVTVPTNIYVDIYEALNCSNGGLTIAAQPTSGDKVTIGDKTYIFVPIGTDTADGEVSIGADLAEAQANFVAAVNGTDGISDPHPQVSIEDFDADNNIAVVTALIAGTAGDLIDTTETFTSESNVFINTTLDNGADCSAVDAASALATAITALSTEGVSAEVGNPGTNTVEMTASLGAAGNDIPISTDMANATFGVDVTTMLGGVNGTPASGINFMIDDTNIYVSLGDNKVTGANWRKIAFATL